MRMVAVIALGVTARMRIRARRERRPMRAFASVIPSPAVEEARHQVGHGGRLPGVLSAGHLGAGGVR
jgi:hypothetical protein